jgi:hypothetical protein
MAKNAKIDLTLIKKLLGELETSLATAEGIKADAPESDVTDYIVELSKAAGLAANVMTEAGLLTGDIAAAIRSCQANPSGKDPLATILGALKGGGGGLPGTN